jgi:hypothetical protein
MSSRVFRLLTLVMALALLLAGCGGTETVLLPSPGPTPTAALPTSPTPAPTEAPQLPEATASPTATIPTPPPTTPTPTPTTGLPPHGVAPTATPPESSEGELEVRIPFDIYAANEPPAPAVPACVNQIPFHLFEDGARTLLEGEGSIGCHFEDTPQDSPITFHVLLEFDATLDGELLPPTVDMPSGWLDAQLGFEGSVTQYYVGYPAGATNPCPESDPCIIPSADFIPLPLAYEEGSTITNLWIFVLHLR